MTDRPGADPRVSDQTAIEQALADAHRSDWAFMVAATVRVVRDLDLAEECVQDAYAIAATTWGRTGIPDNPAAWLTTTARRRGIDLVRREQTLRTKLPLLVDPDPDPDQEDEAVPPIEGLERVRDERLRLIFLCCHPALSQEAQVALTLRLVCGLSTSDIARGFLVSESTMAARLTRAKKKIAGSRIPFRIPAADQLDSRLQAVLGVGHLLFTTGHTAPSGAALVRHDLVDTSTRLARTLHELLPDEPEVDGFLALVLATTARRTTRVGGDGRLLRLADQDRTQWDRSAIAEAQRLVMSALSHPRAGRYALQAAIACQHAAAPTSAATDWPQILGLYDALFAVWPSSVVALNRVVAVAEVAGPGVALSELDALGDTGELDGYHYLPALRADLLRRLGRTSDAIVAYQEALRLTENEAEQQFLRGQIIALADVPLGPGATEAWE